MNEKIEIFIRKYLHGVLISIAIFLFGLAILLYVETLTLFWIIITFSIWIGLSIVFIYGIAIETEDVEYKPKNTFLGLCLAVAFFLFCLAAILSLFPGSFTALLIVIGVWLILSVAAVNAMTTFDLKGENATYEYIFVVAFLLLAIFLMIAFFPGDLIAALVIVGAWIFLSAVIFIIGDFK